MLNMGLSIGIGALGGRGAAAEPEPPPAGPTVLRDWLEPAYFVNGTGTQYVQTAYVFTGAVTSYSLVGSPPGGVSINSTTGVISVTTGSDFAWTEVTVRGTNGDGGTTDVTIDLRVLTPTKTIDMGAGQRYWDVTPVPGDIVVCRGGTETAEIWYLNTWVGSSGSPIELLAYPGERCVFDFRAKSGDNAIYAGDTHDLIIRGFEIVGGSSMTSYGISFYKSYRVTAAQNSVSGFQLGGIYIGSDDHATANNARYEYNRVYQNVNSNSARSASSGWPGAMKMDVCDNSVIRRNWVFENYGEGILTLACIGMTIEENYVHDNFSANIYLDNMQSVTCTGNTVWSDNSGYYRDYDGAGAGGFLPAVSILAANEAYPGQAYLVQTSSGIVVEGNFILDTNTQPLYDGSYGTGGGAGAGSSFSPNTTFSTVVAAWKASKSPTVVSRANNASSTSDATSFTVTMPGSIVPGNIILAHIAADGAPTLTVNTGSSGTRWKKLGQASNSTTATGAIFWKYAEGSDALVITSSASEQFTATTIQINGGKKLDGVSANGSGTNSDPANLAPLPGLWDYLWIATRAGDAQVVATVAPTNYGNLQSQAAAGANGASSNTAERPLRAASENPGTFTSASEQWAAWTLAVAS